MSARDLKNKHKFFIQVTNIIQKFNETIEADKATIQSLQAELKSVKEKSNEIENQQRIATSCSFLGNMGYSESGTFFLDTDGLGMSEVPYEVNN